ncbi:MAG: DUF2309 domain-containing protein [Acidimicrobiales bacterium]
MTLTEDPAPSIVEAAAPLLGVEPALRAAAGRIAPLWPLERFVAVNPYLGLTDHRFGDAAERLAATAGARTTLPAEFYLDAVDDGRVSLDDVAWALAAHEEVTIDDPATFLAIVRAADDELEASTARVPSVAEVAAAVTGHDWVRLCVDRVSAWAAAYFDEGQAMWRSADRAASPYAAWRDEARIDRTPEVMGLPGFRATVRSLPADPIAAAEQVLHELGVPAEALELYLHALLLRVGGWAAYAARIAWDAGLAGDDDDSVVELAAILLAWELAVLRAEGDRGTSQAWETARSQLRMLAAHPAVRTPLAHRLVLQDAFDRAEQRRLVAQLSSGPATPSSPRPRPGTQAVFCIDVRSEVLRRHLEAAAPDLDTIGFAGFFGFPVEFVPLAHAHGEAQCPVLLTPAYTVAETAGDAAGTAAAVEGRRRKHHVRRAWKSFKMGAVSCFSFVGPVGLVYLPKLFTDGYGSTRPVKRAEDEGLGQWAIDHKGPSLDPTGAAAGIPLAGRVQLAEGALRGMSLTDGFAPLVMITGHGASTVNNPYDTGLDCGACGGHTGESNARVAAAILNDPDVRAALAAKGIVVPDDTWFVAALHDTTTDEVTLFDRALVPANHADRVAELERQLAVAGRGARAERAPRLGIAEGEPVDAAVIARSRDWAQVRPEWGLAGCRAFIVAPRRRTEQVDLGGRAFLHSYDWRQDEGFGVLELVMTAPMVVASWISLQYYASTVENRLFGSGNKTLHNVVGRMGVLEGNGGDLRTGLPWQSVHDGEDLQHEPLRLNVVIEAPIDAMNDVLAKHDGVRDLVDNGWLHLLAMDDSGTVSHRYVGGLRWEPVAG